MILKPSALKAQQDFINGFYMFNPLAFNPAITGVNDQLVLSGIVREQWTGLNGAPNTQYFNAHMPVFTWYDRYDRPGNITYPTGLSTGIMLLNDKIASTDDIEGIRLTRVSIPIGTRIRLTKSGLRLSFGLRVDGARFSANLDGARQDGGDVVSSPPEYYLDFSSGLYLYHTKWYMGVSMTNMRAHELSGFDYSMVHHYYASAGYAQPINQGLVLRLTTLATVVYGTPFTMTVTPAAIIQDNIETGITYRYHDMIGAFFSFKPLPNLKAGYWYEYPIGAKTGRIGATHEVMLQMTFERFKKRVVSPRYFW